MKRGQVWIETVIYTLIGLSLIGLVLGFVSPKITEYKDKAVIEQTIQSMNLIDSKINEVLQAPGNTRIVELQLKRGALFVDKDNNKIYFDLSDSKILYSESGVETSIGRIEVLSVKGQKTNDVKLTIDYKNYLDFDDTGVEKISASATPYRLSIINNGFATIDGKIVANISIKVIS
jgi:type II secretory pathway pseudopilin PulG